MEQGTLKKAEIGQLLRESGSSSPEPEEVRFYISEDSYGDEVTRIEIIFGEEIEVEATAWKMINPFVFKVAALVEQKTGLEVLCEIVRRAEPQVASL